MNSASLCSLVGRYDNPIPPRFLAPIDSSVLCPVKSIRPPSCHSLCSICRFVITCTDPALDPDPTLFFCGMVLYLQLLVPTHLISAAPGPSDIYVPVGIGTYSTSSVQRLDPQKPTPTYLYVPDVFRIPIKSGQWIRIRTGIQLKCWIRIRIYKLNPDPKHWVLGPTLLISAAPGSADTYIPVGTGTYSPRQCSAWICRYLHTCRYWQCFGSGFNQVSGSRSGFISSKNAGWIRIH